MKGKSASAAVSARPFRLDSYNRHNPKLWKFNETARRNPANLQPVISLAGPPCSSSHTGGSEGSPIPFERKPSKSIFRFRVAADFREIRYLCGLQRFSEPQRDAAGGRDGRISAESSGICASRRCAAGRLWKAEYFITRAGRRGVDAEDCEEFFSQSSSGALCERGRIGNLFCTPCFS